MVIEGDKRLSSVQPRAGKGALRDRSVHESELLDAALDLFLISGPRAVTMVDLAKATSVSRASLYRRWPNILAVLRAVAVREFTQIFNSVVSSEPIASGADLVRLLVELVSVTRSHVLVRSLAAEEPTFFATYLVARRSTVSEDFVAVLRPVLETGVASGALQPPENGDVDELARTVLLCCTAFLLTGPLVHDASRVDPALGYLLERLLVM